MAELRWNIEYIDGSEFSNLDGRPEDAPGGGVESIAQEDTNGEVGTIIHNGSDFYVFDKQYGGWYGMDIFGFVQYLIRPGLKIIKLAETTTIENFLALRKRIKENPNLPDKSANYPWETHI
jgi:hypothetical protein